jgi:hypothetical protein
VGLSVSSIWLVTFRQFLFYPLIPFPHPHRDEALSPSCISSSYLSTVWFDNLEGTSQNNTNSFKSNK